MIICSVIKRLYYSMRTQLICCTMPLWKDCRKVWNERISGRNENGGLCIEVAVVGRWPLVEVPGSSYIMSTSALSELA